MAVIAPWQLLSASVIMVIFTHTQGCPSVCQCTTKNGQLIVDCSGRSLSSSPDNLPLNVTELDLSDNFIKDLTTVFHTQNVSEHSGILSLKKLRRLSLANNFIDSIPEYFFLNQSVLNTLDLSQNNIGFINNEMFTGLENLLHLNLSGNTNLEIGNNTFQTMTSLVELDLSHTGVLLENLRIPLTVQRLHLHGNNLDFLNSSVFSNLHELVFLDISNNNLTYLDDITFPPMESLKILNISRNNIEMVSTRAFSAMPNLDTLILDYNPISEINGQIFQHLSHLKYLSVSYMPALIYIEKDTFSGLQSVSTLQMKHNPSLEYIHVMSFADLVSAKLINLSYNNLTALHPIMFSTMDHVTIDIQGNHFPCDCNIEWVTETDNISNIFVMDATNVGCYNNGFFPIINQTELHCGEINVQTNITKYETKIGSSAILHCGWMGNPAPLITWVTPRGRKLVYYGSHALIWKSYPTVEDVMENSLFHMDHQWHNSSSYQSDLQQNLDRIIVLNNGDLFIDYMLRSDTGIYQCVVENSRNRTFVEITLYTDQSIFNEVKIWSILIGLACAASFFTLNLIYVVISALVRRCINQRRRDAITKLVENIDQYKSAQLARLRDNYYTQLHRIRDGYHNQLERIRDNYSSQATRFREGATLRREWASQKVDNIRENYNIQVTRLKDNSAQKLEQLRDTYNNQLLRIRDYGSSQMTRIHKKYKLKQRHVMKLLETMNFDNCRQIIDSECVRAESMIFETDLTDPELNIPSLPQSDDDTEYQTASSNMDSPVSSRLDLHHPEEMLLLNSSHVSSHLKGEDSCQLMGNDSSQLMGDNPDQLKGVNSSQLKGDNSSQLTGENSGLFLDQTSEHEFDADDEDDITCIEEMFNCDDIEQMLVQIQLIDESDNDSEKNENSRNIETCV